MAVECEREGAVGWCRYEGEYEVTMCDMCGMGTWVTCVTWARVGVRSSMLAYICPFPSA